MNIDHHYHHLLGLWERVSTETDMLPNADALQLHWKRCLWVSKYWQQSVDSVMSLPPLTDFGWSTFLIYLKMTVLLPTLELILLVEMLLYV
jgi:hypothetical protein